MLPAPEVLFQTANSLALLCWIALAASPAHRRWTPAVHRLTGRVVPIGLGVVYVAIFLRTGMGDGGYDSLAAVQRLFADPTRLTAGWIHYLAFDLFVGTWIAERAGALGVPHLLVLPLLVLTFLFGPAGLLGYAVVIGAWRWHRRRNAAA
jgi:hypothetical protein